MASFLDNVVLEDFDFILEGEQADKYKARKAAEKAYADSKNASDKARYGRREAIGSKPIYRSSRDATDDKKDKELNKNFQTKSGMYDDVYNKRNNSITGKSKDSRVRRDMQRRYDSGERISSDDYNRAYDASRRNARRHPQKESTFFDDVELI